MDWVTIIQTTLASSSIIAIVLVVLGFIARNLFSQILSKDIELYKSKLQSESDQLKANLEKVSIEHQVMFERLHAKRADVIAELYSLIIDVEKDTLSIINPAEVAGEPAQKYKRDKAYQNGEKLSDYFSKNRIYFKEDLCVRIESFIEGRNSALTDFDRVIHAFENDIINHMDMLDRWTKTWKDVSEDIPTIKKDIEKEFRQLLGIEEAS